MACKLGLLRAVLSACFRYRKSKVTMSMGLVPVHGSCSCSGTHAPSAPSDASSQQLPFLSCQHVHMLCMMSVLSGAASGVDDVPLLCPCGDVPLLCPYSTCCRANLGMPWLW
jgi:hypothetical protein